MSTEAAQATPGAAPGSEAKPETEGATHPGQEVPREGDEPNLTASRFKSLAAHLLVAAPHLRDPNFERSVVLLLGHDEQGAVGLILTHPSRFRGSDVGHRLKVRVAGKAATAPVLEGGPVAQDKGFVLHGRPDLASDPPVAPGIYVDPPEKVLEQLLRDGEAQARLYVGYCGWGPDQLEAEIAHGDWYVTSVTPRAVFDIAAEALWMTLLRERAEAVGSGKPPVKRPKKP